MILMYHKVSLESPTMWWVDVNNFYRQMVELSHKKVVYLNDYNPQDESHVVITFDGIYKNVLEYALPILQQFGYPFELFFTSDYLGKDNLFDTVEPNAVFVNEEGLKELKNGGGRLQWHTKSHVNLKKVSDNKLIEDELKVPEKIKELDKNGFNWFAYPHGEYNELVLNKIKEKFDGAVSCNQGNNYDKYIYNRITVINDTTFRKRNIACIIASYNYGSYLIESIESVLKQTILPQEILISDDCSDDETQIIAESYVRKFPNLISYNRNQTNMGIVNHFNKAISLTKSEYVFFLGADNRLLSNYVEETSRILDSDERNAISYTDYSFFGPRAKLIYQTFDEERRERIINDIYYEINFPEFFNRDEMLIEINKGNFIHGSSMFKRKAFDEVGGYKHTNTAEDYDLFRRIIDVGWNAKKASSTNLEYRQHGIGQANSVLSLQNKMLFYKELYQSSLIKKNNFENSLIFKYSFLFYRAILFVKYNYKSPKKVFRKIIKKVNKSI